ncbi:hypothetical protein PP1_007115 [Pseudonocardia sp. P1]
MSTHQIAYAAKCDPPRLRGYKSSEFGPWFFEKSDLDAWLDSMRNTPSPSRAKRANRRSRATAAAK